MKQKVIILMEGLGKMEASMDLIMVILVKEERERIKAKGQIPGAQLPSYLYHFDQNVRENEASLQRCMRRANPMRIISQVRDERLSDSPFREMFMDYLPESVFSIKDDPASSADE